jgi:hypothetical protein
MAWFRTNRGVAAWLAFFALACQLLFSFGHVHVGNVSSGLAASVAVQTTDGTADAPSPPQKKPAGFASDFCAVCANLSMASALILPVLALVLAPGLFIKALPWSLAARAPDSFDPLPVRARGPPLA